MGAGNQNLLQHNISRMVISKSCVMDSTNRNLSWKTLKQNVQSGPTWLNDDSYGFVVTSGGWLDQVPGDRRFCSALFI